MQPELRALIEGGPLAHLSTVNRDGSPQTTLIWIGLDGEDVLSAHMHRTQKIRNLERDPRFTLSFLAPPDPGAFLAPYAVLKGRARIERGPAAALLHRLGRLYVGPEFVFPVPEEAEGFLVRYGVEAVGGTGPWAS
jgi:PPOX class probable F420-dependent enzyme